MFLRNPMTPAEARDRVEEQLRGRAESFLAVLERGVFARPTSPYRRLCEHAGVSLADVTAWVREDGVEHALTRLFEAGVHLSHAEFKGRVPIERPGLRLEPRHQDFDNPLLAAAYRARTGGSRGAGTRVSVDLELLTHDAAHQALSEVAFDLRGRTSGQWRPVPPFYAAMNIALRAARVGHPLERWFSHSRLSLRPDALPYTLLTAWVVAASRLLRNPVPAPRHVPLSEAWRVAEWLAEKVRAGTPAFFDCPSSSAVRVCLAAAERGLDLRGTLFRVGGDPHTAEKARVVESVGAAAVVRYSLTELGNVGMPCARPNASDSVHLLLDKLAFLQRERAGRPAATSLVVTTLLPASPKLMLNVDIDDYGVLEEDDCGCPLYEMGLRLRMHGIRSHEKLTSEGTTFEGERLLRLVDEILPARFGGHAADYQLVESDEGGLSRVDVVVSPRVGEIDERAVAAAVIGELAAHNPAWRVAAEQWREGGTLRVVRREPAVTGAGKVLPLRIARSG